jgi:NADH-quinone oxidoreductase subunit N
VTLGFWGKVYLFGAAIQGGFIWLAIIGLLASLVSAYYYLMVIVMMYMKPGDPDINCDLWVHIIAITCALLVVGVSFSSRTLLDWAGQALLILK